MPPENDMTSTPATKQAMAAVKAPTLTAAQVQSFNDTGYLVARKAFDAATMATITTWAEEVEAAPEVSGQHWVYWENSLKDPERKIIARIENIAAHHAGFRALTEALKTPVGQLLAEPAALFKEKINFKKPGGDGFKPHQDSQAGWEAYASYFISVLVCIDPATLLNGCLKVVAGHHRRGLFREWEPLTEADMAGMDFQPVPTEPGDLIFFDSYAPHASDPNLTEATRRLYYVTYNRLSEGDHLARYYADKHKNFPPDVDRIPGKDYRFRV